MSVALLRPPAVRKLVALLRLLPAREQATILAQAVHEGTMTRAGADQVLIALALDVNGRSSPVTRAALRPVSTTRGSNGCRQM
jgi:hypothetical protein